MACDMGKLEKLLASVLLPHLHPTSSSSKGTSSTSASAAAELQSTGRAARSLLLCWLERLEGSLGPSESSFPLVQARLLTLPALIPSLCSVTT